jgi:hypothetical protein
MTHTNTPATAGRGLRPGAARAHSTARLGSRLTSTARSAIMQVGQERKLLTHSYPQTIGMSDVQRLPRLSASHLPCVKHLRGFSALASVAANGKDSLR